MAGDNGASGDNNAPIELASASEAQHSTLGGELLTERSRHSKGQKLLPLPDKGQEPQRFTSHSKYMSSLNSYWAKLTDAKHRHFLVAAFPPMFVPPETALPQPPPEIDIDSLNTRGKLPSLNDLRDASKSLTRFAYGNNKLPDFQLKTVDEAEFKKRYATEAEKIGQQDGFDKPIVHNIVQSIYAFEDGGWGTYDTLSGMPQALVAPDAPGQTRIADARGNYHPLSTGLGYNQLLRPTTMLSFDQHAGDISTSLRQDAAQDPSRKDELLAKADLVDHLKTAMDKELKRMGHRIGGHEFLENGDARSALYGAFANSDSVTASGIPAKKVANAVHALNLDGDIGPKLQAQELSGLLNFAHGQNFVQLLENEASASRANAAAYDALPADRKTKAVDEIMQRIHADKITASSTIPISDQDVASFRELLTKLNEGNNDALYRENMNNAQFALLNLGALTIKKLGDPAGPLSGDAKLLLDKLVHENRDGLTAYGLLPAAIELVNLAGEGNAFSMLQPKNSNYPTTNFFSRQGYYANGVTNERSAGELLLQVDRIMNGLNRDPKKPGQAQFDSIFHPTPDQ